MKYSALLEVKVAMLMMNMTKKMTMKAKELQSLSTEKIEFHHLFYQCHTKKEITQPK